MCTRGDSFFGMFTQYFTSSMDKIQGLSNESGEVLELRLVHMHGGLMVILLDGLDVIVQRVNVELVAFGIFPGVVQDPYDITKH